MGGAVTKKSSHERRPMDSVDYNRRILANYRGRQEWPHFWSQ